MDQTTPVATAMADLDCVECIEAAHTLSRLNHDSSACAAWSAFWREYKGEKLRHFACDMADVVVAATARAKVAEAERDAVRQELAAARKEIERLTEVDEKWQRWARDHVLCEERERHLCDVAVKISIYGWHAKDCPRVNVAWDATEPKCSCGFTERYEAVQRLRKVHDS